MPMPRHGIAGAVIGNRFHLVSGMMQSAGALTFLDPTLSTHTAMHDILELQFGAPPPTRCCEERCRGAFAGSGTTARQLASTSRRRVCDGRGSACPGSEEGLHALQRQQPGRPGDAREIRAGDRDHAGVAGTRPAFLELVVEYPLGQGLPGVPVGSVQEEQDRSHRLTSAGVSSRRRGRVERLPGPPRPTLRTPSSSSSGTSCRGID